MSATLAAQEVAAKREPMHVLAWLPPSDATVRYRRMGRWCRLGASVTAIPDSRRIQRSA
jgi:hypothetical protein